MTTAELLAEAQSAYHRLQTGGLPVEVRDLTGESVRYSPANASRLKAYISDLKATLAAESQGAASAARGPIRPMFT